jgi:biopolymer transport protein ExbB/TolQ
MSKIWVALKSSWKIIVLVFFAIFGLILLRRRDQTLLDEIEGVRQSHREEIRKIEEAREKERLAHEKNMQRLQEDLALIRSQYEAAKVELSKKKEAEITKILSDFGSDPDRLALELQRATGFKIIYPERE